MYHKTTPPAFSAPSIEERKRLLTRLTSAGLTLTNSRIRLLHYLSHITIPITAFDLSEQVGLPLSTTHRNLSTFADLELVDFIVDRLGVCRWYLMTTEHDSYCPTCNQIFNAA